MIEYQLIEVGKRKQKIFILDNILSMATLETLRKYFEDLDYRFFDADRPDIHHIKHLVHSFSLDEENPVLSGLTSIVEDFMKSQEIPLTNVSRMYANFNRFGDFQFTHEDGDEWTSLTFISREWKEDWGGDLLMYDPDRPGIAYAIFPLPGRMVIFDGEILHRGGTPSKLCYDPRISMAIKFNR